MFDANAYVIRRAGESDEGTLRRLAALDSQRPLHGTVLIGELDGRAGAAVSVDDQRVVADPCQPTATLVTFLRLRARSLHALDTTPELRKRLYLGVRAARAVRA
jgi:hypothetical protein